MTANDHELLRQFVANQSQDAFTALVNRHINLVYSAALRQVRSPQLAEDISLTVFSQLARNAASLAADTILSAWLYRVTRHAAVDVIRGEARRSAREQIALQMNEANEPNREWAEIEPLLDEAMEALDEEDRQALLLRYFENKSLREVGLALGASEDAAQKRVSRAVERLRDLLTKREVSVGAAALVLMLSTNAVKAAPVALASSIAASAATVSSAAILSATAVTATKTLAMTTLQKTAIAVIVAAAIGTAAYQVRQSTQLRSEVNALKEEQTHQASAAAQAEDLRAELERATNAIASLTAENAELKKRPTEAVKLRGEVGRLRKENADFASSSPLSKATANPEARKLLRDQQKMGMSMMYKSFARDLKLSPEQTEKLNDLLADNIMTNVDRVTMVLRDKSTPEQMEQVFAGAEAELQQQIEGLVGPEGASKYQEYNKNLLSELTSDQFSGQLEGDKASKAEKLSQLRQALKDAARAVLAANGLPADYQAIPILNFRNIASEQSGDQAIKTLEQIYSQAASQAASFLTPGDLKKFKDFTALAINNNRSALALNRSFMAPLSQ